MTRLKRVACAAILMLATAAVAQEKRRPKPDAESPSAPMLAPRVAALDTIVADLILARADTPADQLPRAELLIDLRLVERALLDGAVAAEAMSDTQAALYLRVLQLEAASALVEAGGDIRPSPATDALHKWTYTMKPLRGAADSDSAARIVGLALASALSVPADTLRADRPPTPPSAPAPTRSPTTAAAAVPTVTDLRGRLPSLAISPDLRRQLMVLADRAALLDPAGPDAPPEIRAERTESAAALATAVRIAEGLATNLAVSPRDRADLEKRMAVAVALYADPRTRAGARDRLDALEPYARLLARVGRLGLSAQQMATFAPAFDFARRNPTDAPAVFTAIEKFLADSATLDTRLTHATTRPSAGPFKPALDAAEKAAVSRRQEFLDAAGTLAHGQPAGGLATPGAELTYMLELLTAIDDLPAAVTTLSTFKVKAPMPLEKRIAGLALQAGGLEPSTERSAAWASLDDVSHLAAAIADINRATPPPTAPAGWGGEQFSAFEAKRKSTALELLQAFASGNPVDRARLARLTRSTALYDNLRLAATVEQSLTAVDAGGQWADNTVDAATLRRMLAPLSRASAGGFTAFIRDDAAEFDASFATRKRFDPLLDFAAQLGAMRTTRLPDPKTAVVARLLTPFDKAPFAPYRIASLTAAVWNFDTAREDQTAADALLDDWLRRLPPPAR